MAEGENVKKHVKHYAAFDIAAKFGEGREDAFSRLLFESKVTRLLTIEHKCDQIALKTRNVFVECQQRGKYSGIHTSKSDFWAIEFDYECWIVMRTARLREIVNRIYEQYPERGRNGGDNQNWGVLVRLHELL